MSSYVIFKHHKLIDTIDLQLFVRYGNDVEGQVKV